MGTVEKVARAIYHGTPRIRPFEQLAEPHKRYWLKRARAAIRAMMEPTEEMENAAGGTLCSAIEAGTEDPLICGAIWRAMIRAGLEAEGEHDGQYAERA